MKETTHTSTMFQTFRVCDLKNHPIFDEVPQPMMKPDSIEFMALVEDIREHGVRQSPTVTDTGLVVDGRHRVAAARAAGIEKLSCVLLGEADAAEAVVTSLALRRHYGKAALAFALYPTAKKCAEMGKRVRSETSTRNFANVSRKLHSVQLPADDMTLSAFAVKCGVGMRTLFLARDVHALLAEFGDMPAGEMTVRARVMELLFDQGKGFQPVLAMLSAYQSGETHAKACEPGARTEYAKYIWQGLSKMQDHWAKLDEDDDKEMRDRVFAIIPGMVNAWPKAIRLKVEDALKVAKAGLLEDKKAS
jgi:hypothetical protein